MFLAHCTHSHGIVVLELFSGAGTHSTLVSGVLINNLLYKGKHGRKHRVNISRLTVDNVELCKPSLLADMGVWTPQHTSALQARFPNKHFVVLASPPCQVGLSPHSEHHRRGSSL